MGIFNFAVRELLKRRYSGIEHFMLHPHDVQERVFHSLIQQAANTEWGKRYDYRTIRSYEEYAKRVPVSTYEQIYPYIEKTLLGKQNVLWPSRITWFSKSSGTTNDRSKYIPVSPEALKICHYNGGKDLLSMYFQNVPKSQMFKGKNIGIGGTYKRNHMHADSYMGDVSAVILANLPFWAQLARTPSLKVALMSDWEEKIEKHARLIMNEDVASISGVPTWTVILMERILEITGKQNMLEVWPDFEVFFHGAVAFTPYRELFKKIFPSDQVHYVETYNASEGFFGIQDQMGTGDMLLLLDHGIYYEFIPVEELDKEHPLVLPLSAVELGKSYAMVISTNSGLWRYSIGDTVRFVSIAPYRIRITGRTKHFINVFGEELVIENAETALSKACEKTGALVSNFTAGPIFFGADKQKGGHEWIIEFTQQPKDLHEFTQLLDEELRAINSDYDAKRYKDMALLLPKLHVAPEGTFYQWMKRRGKLGGQNKVPRLSNSREFLEDLLKNIKW
ncbi:MAG: auxin-regulated protein [Cytophagaceae bacterium]|jgi:hypothetical protein|nr:auxin-regulated protein [Cytophagaceae bacterium]